jgi:hypothetical protein
MVTKVNSSLSHVDRRYLYAHLRSMKVYFGMVEATGWYGAEVTFNATTSLNSIKSTNWFRSY